MTYKKPQKKRQLEQQVSGYKLENDLSRTRSECDSCLTFIAKHSNKLKILTYNEDSSFVLCPQETTFFFH
jgi:ribosomal protein S27AE